MKRFLLIALVLITSGCEPNQSNSNNAFLNVKIGSTRLAIPQDFVLPRLPGSLVPDSGLDIGDGVSLDIPLSELGFDVDTDIGSTASLIVLVSSITDASKLNRVSQNALNAWNAAGAYKTRVIEFDHEVGLYRVYPSSGYPVFWQYFKSSPLQDGDVASNWVASCRASSSSFDAGKISAITCTSRRYYKDVKSQITLFGKYIQEFDSIMERYERMLVSWEETE